MRLSTRARRRYCGCTACCLAAVALFTLAARLCGQLGGATTPSVRQLEVKYRKAEELQNEATSRNPAAGLERWQWAGDDLWSSSELNVLQALMECITWTLSRLHDDAMDREPWLRTRAWTGNSHIGNREPQLSYYYILTRLVAPSVICEIGLNGGHSAATFLAAAPKRNSRLVSFDLMAFSYSSTAASLLASLFPSQLRIIQGSSFVTVPAFSRDHGRICDLFSIDGDHSYEGVSKDIRNAVAATRPNGIIILDDMDYKTHPESRTSFDEAVVSGLLRDPVCVENISVGVPTRDRFDESPAHMRHLVAAWCVALAPERTP